MIRTGDKPTSQPRMLPTTWQPAPSPDVAPSWPFAPLVDELAMPLLDKAWKDAGLKIAAAAVVGAPPPPDALAEYRMFLAASLVRSSWLGVAA